MLKVSAFYPYWSVKYYFYISREFPVALNSARQKLQKWSKSLFPDAFFHFLRSEVLQSDLGLTLALAFSVFPEAAPRGCLLLPKLLVLLCAVSEAVPASGPRRSLSLLLGGAHPDVFRRLLRTAGLLSSSFVHAGAPFIPTFHKDAFYAGSLQEQSDAITLLPAVMELTNKQLAELSYLLESRKVRPFHFSKFILLAKNSCIEYHLWRSFSV